MDLNISLKVIALYMYCTYSKTNPLTKSCSNDPVPKYRDARVILSLASQIFAYKNKKIF